MSAFGQHRKFSPHARKTSHGYPGYVDTHWSHYYINSVRCRFVLFLGWKLAISLRFILFKQPLAELAVLFKLSCFVHVHNRFFCWPGLSFVSVLLLFKIATVPKDFKLKIDFVFSFHLILLSDFCLDFSCSLLSSGVVKIIYNSTWSYENRVSKHFVIFLGVIVWFPHGVDRYVIAWLNCGLAQNILCQPLILFRRCLA